MSLVSPVFHTEATVSIGLKIVAATSPSSSKRQSLLPERDSYPRSQKERIPARNGRWQKKWEREPNKERKKSRKAKMNQRKKQEKNEWTKRKRVKKTNRETRTRAERQNWTFLRRNSGIIPWRALQILIKLSIGRP